MFMLHLNLYLCLCMRVYLYLCVCVCVCVCVNSGAVVVQRVCMEEGERRKRAAPLSVSRERSIGNEALGRVQGLL
jgi:hypothetical protein